jgi:CheY-like chemotaxis protein/anti-sigma regulatory factor (Ser/Thr protein kinase)
MLESAPFRVVEAVEDVAALISARVAEKDLELIVRVDPRLPSILVGDVGRFRQIITNLLGNAVKFTEKGHVLIDVSGEAVDGQVVLKVLVEDTGIGIPEDRLRIVFDKFAQVDSTSTRRYEGTGLGLAIASRLVQLMGGRIEVESELGRGSMFRFGITLPVDDSSGEKEQAPTGVSGARVLIVDDNPVNRQILLEQLRSWDFDCAAAESGAIALAFIEKSGQMGVGIDCVILDYQMPGMNGAEVAKAIRRMPCAVDTPILLLTSVDQVDFGRFAAEWGVDGYLTKPARSTYLFNTLVSVIQKGRERAARAGRLRPVPADVPGAGRPVPAPRPPRQQSVDILVAEDNEVNQLVFSQILDSMGMSYRLAANGRTAVEMHRALRPRLILMDVSMPEMSGYEAARAIRAAEKTGGAHTPIVGVTAHALTGDREKCLEAGMDDYLPKPVSPDRLAAKINMWLSQTPAALSA